MKNGQTKCTQCKSQNSIQDPGKTRGAFHSTANLETVADGMKVLGKVSRNSRLLEKAIHSRKILEIPDGKQNGTDIPGNDFSEVSANCRRLSCFP